MKVPVFMYHEVNRENIFPELGKYINKKYLIDNYCFEEQLNYMNCHHYKAVTISELFKIENIDRTVVVTFDDGYVGNYLYAFKTLKKFNFKATFFVTTDWIGLPNMLSWEALKEMSEFGMEIGSHTCSHLLLGEEPENRIREELLKSKLLLESNLNKKIDTISYPNGNFNQTVNEIALECGYGSACVSEFGYWNSESNDFIIPRMPAVNNINSFRSILKNNSPYVFKEIALDKIKKGLRKLIGGRIYNRLYMKIFNLQEIKK
jgi:peptidoglycan/xylan/chitin deacetylase (PgdA/CDA1 family)